MSTALPFLPEPSYSVLVDTPVSGPGHGKLVLSGETLRLEMLKPKRETASVSLDAEFGTSLSRTPDGTTLFLEIRQRRGASWERVGVSCQVRTIEGVGALPPLIRTLPRIAETDFIHLLARIRAAMQEQGFESWGLLSEAEAPVAKSLSEFSESFENLDPERGFLVSHFSLPSWLSLPLSIMAASLAAIPPFMPAIFYGDYNIPNVLFGLFFWCLTFYVLSSLLTTRYVKVERGRIELSYGPFVFLQKSFETRDMRQLYAEQYRGSKGQRYFRVRAQVRARTITITKTPSEHRALELERFLEGQLGIEDTYVEGEIYRFREPPESRRG